MALEVNCVSDLTTKRLCVIAIPITSELCMLEFCSEVCSLQVCGS
jgi:hypothetical protein